MSYTSSQFLMNLFLMSVCGVSLYHAEGVDSFTLFWCGFIGSVSFVRLLEGYSANDGKQLSYLALEESVFYKQGFLELGALLQSADPLLMEPAEKKTFFISILLWRLG